MEPDVLECRCSSLNHDGGLQVRQFRARAVVDSGAEGQTVALGAFLGCPGNAVIAGQFHQDLFPGQDRLPR
jgi:hypothetical protein